MFVDLCIIVQFINKNPTRCNNVSKFVYSIFIWSSTCFGRHTAHHQVPKTALAASGFSYMEGCWTLSGTYCAWQRPPTMEGCWTLSGTYCAWQHPPTTHPTTFQVRKTRGCQCSSRLLMMGGVSPETCSASYKYGIIKFWYIVVSCWIFFLWKDTQLMLLPDAHQQWVPFWRSQSSWKWIVQFNSCISPFWCKLVLTYPLHMITDLSTLIRNKIYSNLLHCYPILFSK